MLSRSFTLVSSPSLPRAKSFPCVNPIFASERTTRSRWYLYFMRFSKGSAEQIIRIDHNIYQIIEAHRKSLVHNVGRGVLGEEWSLENNLEKGGEETFDRWKTNLGFWETKQWYLEADRHGNKRPRLWKNTQALNHEESRTTFITWLFHSEDSLNTENLDTLLFFTEKL